MLVEKIIQIDSKLSVTIDLISCVPLQPLFVIEP